MAKKASKSPETLKPTEVVEVERVYTFPELRVAVKAKNMDAAKKAANKKAKEK